MNSSSGNIGVNLPSNSNLGTGTCNIGDLNGDGITDLAVGAPHYNSYGAVFIFFMDTNGTVKNTKILTQNINGIYGLSVNGGFGYFITNLQDINNDGVTDIAVSEVACPDGGNNTGAVHIISLYTNLSVQPTTTSPLCYGDSTGMISVTGSGNNLPFTYHWNNGSTNDTIFNLPAGSYTVTITNIIGDTAVRNIQLSEPLAISLITSSNTSINIGDSTTLMAYAYGGTGAKTIYWDNGLGTGPVKVVTPNNNTTYNTYAVDANNCFSDTNSIVISITTGINNTDLALGNIRVFPNPTKGKLFLEWNRGELMIMALEVYNSVGQMVMSKEVPQNDANAFIDFSVLPKGLFYVKVVASSGEKTFKIVVD